MSEPDGTMTIRILEDGSVKIETTKIAPASHVRAERFLAEVNTLLGDHDEHDHDHDHDGEHTHV